MCKERICTCMVFYAQFRLFCYAYDHVVKNLHFDLLIPRVKCVCGGGGSASKIFDALI